MGDVAWLRMLGTDYCDTSVRSFAGLGEGIVARVKILALL